MAVNQDRHKILIVDDTPECIQTLMEALRDEYTIIVATSGEKALRLADSEAMPDMILLDIRMPGMDGYEVCRRLKENLRLNEIPVIFLSALEATEDKVKAFKAGGVDYITKPFQFDEVQARVRTHLRLKQTLSELEEKRRELQEAYNQLDREFRSVGEVQASLLPSIMPDIPGFEVASYYRPARRAGGDYFDIFRIDEQRWGIFVADVSGHGPPAAIVTAMTHVMLQLAPCKEQPDLVLNFLNTSLQDRIQPDQFVTAFYGILTPAARTLTIAAAGHPPPLLCRFSDGKCGVFLVEGGLPLGISPSEKYESNSMMVEPGDLLFFYTDGVTEAENPDGLFFGMDRFMALVEKNIAKDAPSVIETVCRSVEAFRDGLEQGDDVTLLVVKAEQ